jgi:hypothetical protein
MYERVNINCAEVNSTWVSDGGIYFFNFHIIAFHKKRLTNPGLCVIVIGRMEELRSFFYAQNCLRQKKGLNTQQ